MKTENILLIIFSVFLLSLFIIFGYKFDFVAIVILSIFFLLIILILILNEKGQLNQKRTKMTPKQRADTQKAYSWAFAIMSLIVFILPRGLLPSDFMFILNSFLKGMEKNLFWVFVISTIISIYKYFKETRSLSKRTN